MTNTTKGITGEAFRAGKGYGMRPVMVLESTGKPWDQWGCQRVEILAFNVDGKGTALVRIDALDDVGLRLFDRDIELMDVLVGDRTDNEHYFREVPLPGQETMAGITGMQPLMVLERTEKDDNPLGWDRIELLAFNVDGKGGALVRVRDDDGSPSLRVISGEDDLYTMTTGDPGDLQPFYREVPRPGQST